MMFVEMSRDAVHGGGAWAFPHCLWSPTKKRGGARTWPFWSKILNVKPGDMILHLRGAQPDAAFVGLSYAENDGYKTSARPPDPGEWGYADSFYRADLRDYTPFHRPIQLSTVFRERRDQLEAFFASNRAAGDAKLNLFFVRQKGRLQCQNGAYLSDMNEALLDALFGVSELGAAAGRPVTTVETRTQLVQAKARVGQSEFSREVKTAYGNQCCFPACPVTDARFLVGAHIARWSDNERLRGQLSNGLCLCLMHDRAFELGLFSLDDDCRVYVANQEVHAKSVVLRELRPYHGQSIRVGRVLPSPEALLEHWVRVGIDPHAEVRSVTSPSVVETANF